MALSALRPPSKGSAPTDGVKGIIMPTVSNSVLYNANSADPGETRRLIWVYAICECSCFFHKCMKHVLIIASIEF